MNIEFYHRSTGEVIRAVEDKSSYIILHDGTVCRYSITSFESEETDLTFGNFIQECPHIWWRVR